MKFEPLAWLESYRKRKSDGEDLQYFDGVLDFQKWAILNIKMHHQSGKPIDSPEHKAGEKIIEILRNLKPKGYYHSPKSDYSKGVTKEAFLKTMKVYYNANNPLDIFLMSSEEIKWANELVEENILTKGASIDRGSVVFYYND